MEKSNFCNIWNLDKDAVLTIQSHDWFLYVFSKQHVQQSLYLLGVPWSQVHNRTTCAGLLNRLTLRRKLCHLSMRSSPNHGSYIPLAFCYFFADRYEHAGGVHGTVSISPTDRRAKSWLPSKATLTTPMVIPQWDISQHTLLLLFGMQLATVRCHLECIAVYNSQ